MSLTMCVPRLRLRPVMPPSLLAPPRRARSLPIQMLKPKPK
ncbi:hypothetical protein QN277_009572 [Acacia crassicarpa]|uniref:Uncharacterized protein n=1 Tax=Acacia crassicarpa TaxID=499986 RepID=A0AAE1M6Z8_9FABA|nr:hypothetical protein QN277_009572 [Acacia crassicarpa]